MRWLFRHLNVQFRCGWVVKVLPLEAKILQTFQLLNCTSNCCDFLKYLQNNWINKEVWDFVFQNLIYYTSSEKLCFTKFQTNHINIFSHLNWRNELFYNFRGQALKPHYSTIHCISRCYRWLNLRKFFTLTQISKNRCQITPLRTIYLPKRCSGEWFGTYFRRFEPKWKFSEIKPPLG